MLALIAGIEGGCAVRSCKTAAPTWRAIATRATRRAGAADASSAVGDLPQPIFAVVVRRLPAMRIALAHSAGKAVAVTQGEFRNRGRNRSNVVEKRFHGPIVEAGGAKSLTIVKVAVRQARD